MRNYRDRWALVVTLLAAMHLQGCALPRGTVREQASASTIYRPLPGEETDHLLRRHAPLFEVEDFAFDFNRIGAAAARPAGNDGYEVYIDTNRPTIYAQVQKFTTGRGDYTNLIYRVHFPEVPWPHLTWGRNPGLLVYVTLNAAEEPVLVTTVHTCGCYLAMLPTSLLPREQWPAGWLPHLQNIYGELLPGRLDLPAQEPYGRPVIAIRGRTHRVMGVEFRQGKGQAGHTQPAWLEPMTALEALPFGERTVSFFEGEGRRRGYVKDSAKPLELLLMSWWALDPRIGEDKNLGALEETGVNFHTSLKFWNRKDSNLWNFPEFLKYWDWDL